MAYVNNNVVIVDRMYGKGMSPSDFPSQGSSSIPSNVITYLGQPITYNGQYVTYGVA